MKQRPYTKLLALLREKQADTSKWIDYWRGFWDATRSLRKDLPTAMVLGPAKDKREYMNGYKTGDVAYKTARANAIINPRKKP